MRRFSIRNLLIAGITFCAVGFYVKLTIGLIGHTRFDDAYMVTRYAQHWLKGEGFSWNPVDGPAYGVTSFTYLMLITALLGLTQFPDAIALTLTSYIAGILSIVVLVILGFIVQDNKKSQAFWLTLLCLLPLTLLVMPVFGFHNNTGMETTFSLLANAIFACAIVMAARRLTPATLLFCLFSGYFSFATRPDNGLYALLLPPLFFIASDRRSIKYGLTYFALMLFIIFCSLYANKYVFGDFLPLPFYAKAAGFYKGYLGAVKYNAMIQMFNFWSVSAPFLLVIACTISKKSLKQLAVIASLILATFCYYATVTQIMGWKARYYYPSLAFVVLAANISAFSDRGKYQANQSKASVQIRILLCIAILSPFFFVIRKTPIQLWKKYMIGTPTVFHSRTAYKTRTGGRLPRLGWWASIMAMRDLLKDMPRGTVLAASEYGFIGTQFPELTIIDLVGLHDRTIARHGFDTDYVLSRRPDLIWLPHSDYTAAAAELRDDPTFQQYYKYYPDAYDYGIAVRRESRFFDRIEEVLARDFSRVYKGMNIADYLAEPVVLPDK